METPYLSQQNFTTLKNRVADDNISQLQDQKTPCQDKVAVRFNSTSTTRQPRIFKTIVDVLGEGLKQNFLGNDINMEYLTLTVRSVASTSVKAIQKAVRPFTNRQHNNNGQRRQLNQPCY
jgi:hypothetical protein